MLRPTLGTALFVFATLGPAPAASAGENTYERVEFSTEVSRTVPNNQMNATMSVELTDPDPARLAQQLTLTLNDALRKAAAFPAVKTSSGNQSTWPVYGRSQGAVIRLEGWRGRCELHLESQDFKAMGELIGRLQEKLQMAGVSFVVAADTRRKAEDSMTVEAIAAFRARADAIRSAWNAKGFRLVQMNLGSAAGPPPYVPVMRAMKMADSSEGASAQDIAGGDTRLVVNVSGSIELQP